MYFNILKNDLKRKKTMNVIVLAFIILATMFVSSSVNNIISVTSALDRYFEMANAPEYVTVTMNKNAVLDIDETLKNANALDKYTVENVLFLSSENISFDVGHDVRTMGTNIVQSEIRLNYFLADESILEKVNPGEFYMTQSGADSYGLKTGDKLTITLNGVTREFVLAGKIKDALFGSKQANLSRYIINEEDYKAFLSPEDTEHLYGGKFIYLYSENIDEVLSSIKSLRDISVLNVDRTLMEFCYVIDMIVVGILLVISVILIIISFVVLRFTITFTLSQQFREIGVMKAIGIQNRKIRGVYLIKYVGIAVIGAMIGLIFSFPFGRLLMKVSSQNIILGKDNPVIVNALCAVIVVGVVVLFCYGCTGKVKNFTPIDAIRNGQTGERFRKKSFMNLGKSKLKGITFLAANDITSSPKRYSIIMFTFFLCISLLLMLSATVSTINSKALSTTFGWSDCDMYINSKEAVMCMVEGGHERLEEHLNKMEETLKEHGIPAKCFQEMTFSLMVVHGEKEYNISIFQGVGTTMDMYEYTAGVAPAARDEIAITKLAADKLGVGLGDTVTIKSMEGERNYIITAFFQSMNMQGLGIRIHTDEKINYVQTTGYVDTQIIFLDKADNKILEERKEKLKSIFPEYDSIKTCEESVIEMIGVGKTLAGVKTLTIVLTIILSALITVLMERSFIVKEQGEIALLKALGIENGKICLYHFLRFLFVGITAVFLGEIFSRPLTHLCIDPIFKMMGMELAVNYVIDPVEYYILLPLVVLLSTTISAYLTSLYTRKISASDTANIE